MLENRLVWMEAESKGGAGVDVIDYWPCCIHARWELLCGGTPMYVASFSLDRAKGPGCFERKGISGLV